ncbi:MAG: GGDEF domain-containing protein [Gammaproteobacteria bacterium]|nr:GGDEF domain-containing protein [Gammaproteobacteria bacterium]
MDRGLKNVLAQKDFRMAATMALSALGVLILLPFSLNNFMQGRIGLGFGSLFIVAILGYNAWSIRRGRFPVRLTLFGLVPIVVVYLFFSISTQGVIGVLWCYPAIFSFYMMLPERHAWFANALLVIMAVPTAGQVLDESLVVRVAATLFAASLFAIIFLRVIASQQKKLHDIAVTDSLTGLYNRALLQDDLARAIEQHRRTSVPMALLALDLDHFKSINDRFGHDAGDKVLVGTATLLKQRLRSSDRIYRTGGEEFLILLHDTNTQQAGSVAEELRLAVSNAQLLDQHTVTTSIGVAMRQADELWTDWLRRADARLYEAKEAGRNCVAG